MSASILIAAALVSQTEVGTESAWIRTTEGRVFDRMAQTAPVEARFVAPNTSARFMLARNVGVSGDTATLGEVRLSGAPYGYFQLDFSIPFTAFPEGVLNRGGTRNIGGGVSVLVLDEPEYTVGVLAELRGGPSGDSSLLGVAFDKDVPRFAPRTTSVTFGASMTAAPGPLAVAVTGGLDLWVYDDSIVDPHWDGAVWTEAFASLPFEFGSPVPDLKTYVAPLAELSARLTISSAGTSRQVAPIIGANLVVQGVNHSATADWSRQLTLTAGYQLPTIHGGLGAARADGRVIVALAFGSAYHVATYEEITP